MTKKAFNRRLLCFHVVVIRVEVALRLAAAGVMLRVDPMDGLAVLGPVLVLRRPVAPTVRAVGTTTPVVGTKP